MKLKDLIAERDDVLKKVRHVVEQIDRIVNPNKASNTTCLSSEYVTLESLEEDLGHRLSKLEKEIVSYPPETTEEIGAQIVVIANIIESHSDEIPAGLLDIVKRNARFLAHRKNQSADLAR